MPFGFNEDLGIVPGAGPGSGSGHLESVCSSLHSCMLIQSAATLSSSTSYHTALDFHTALLDYRRSRLLFNTVSRSNQSGSNLIPMY